MPRVVKTSTAAAALALVLAAGCGGGGNKAVAHVGDQAITQKQLDGVVAHFRAEAQREGKDFPEEGTRAFEATRNQLLTLLVYRETLEQAAERLGVEVDPNEVTERLAAAGGEGEEEGDAGGDTFAHDSVVAQIRFEGIFAKVTRGVTGKNAADTSARRNRKMAEFVARLQRETKVRYEPGYAPGP